MRWRRSEHGLGFWQCKLRYWNQEELLNVAREYHRRGIPIDVIVIDFYHWPKCGDYRFDENNFPDPKAMVEELNGYGMELMVSVWPQVNLTSENYEEMKQKGLLVKSERGVPIAMRFQGENAFFSGQCRDRDPRGAYLVLEPGDELRTPLKCALVGCALEFRRRQI